MSAEILNQLPASGGYPEKHYGHNFNSQLWVKFIDNHHQEWVACFSRPREALDKVFTDKANETAFIVAGGQGYLIDVSTRALLHEMDDIPVIESAIHTTDPEYFLAGACYSIYIFDNRKLIKRFKLDFTVDGIYFTEQKDNKAVGHLYSFEYENDVNVGFSFDLVTNEITIDKNVKIRQIEPFDFVTATDTEKNKNESYFAKIIRRLTDKLG